MYFTFQIDTIAVTSHSGAIFDILNGAYLLTIGLKIVLSILEAIYPFVVDALLGNLLKKALQQWIDVYHEQLPF